MAVDTAQALVDSSGGFVVRGSQLVGCVWGVTLNAEPLSGVGGGFDLFVFVEYIWIRELVGPKVGTCSFVEEVSN